MYIIIYYMYMYMYMMKRTDDGRWHRKKRKLSNAQRRDTDSHTHAGDGWRTSFASTSTLPTTRAQSTGIERTPRKLETEN